MEILEAQEGYSTIENFLITTRDPWKSHRRSLQVTGGLEIYWLGSVITGSLRFTGLRDLPNSFK